MLNSSGVWILCCELDVIVPGHVQQAANQAQAGVLAGHSVPCAGPIHKLKMSVALTCWTTTCSMHLCH